MRVMTFNLRSDSIFDGKNRWNKRKDIVFNILDVYQCDIIGLQEVTLKMRCDLEEYLKNYHIVGKARTKKFFVEHNNLLIAKRHTILQEDTFWLSNNPQKIGSSIWYSIFPRICTTAKIQLENGGVVRVYNTHLDCYLSPARGYGLKKIMQYIEKQYELERIPVILMGDFNANPRHKLIKGFLEWELNDQRFVAVQDYNRSIYNQATIGRFKNRDKGMHLDYIFISPEYEVMKVKIIKDNIDGRFPSDHYPLLADICHT